MKNVKIIFVWIFWMIVVFGILIWKILYDNDKFGNLKSVLFKRKNIIDLGIFGILIYK